MIYWASNRVFSYPPLFVSEIFKMHGYDFILVPSLEQVDMAEAAAETMPPWPQEGCIQELEQVVVVNFS